MSNRHWKHPAQLDLVDYINAVAARDAALQRVAENAGEWTRMAYMAFYDAIRDGWEGTGEDVRLTMTDAGLQAPHHHNAWGALTCSLVRRGLLIPTGTWTNMRGEKSHARKTPVYRRAAA